MVKPRPRRNLALYFLVGGWTTGRREPPTGRGKIRWTRGYKKEEKKREKEEKEREEKRREEKRREEKKRKEKKRKEKKRRNPGKTRKSKVWKKKEKIQKQGNPRKRNQGDKEKKQRKKKKKREKRKEKKKKAVYLRPSLSSNAPGLLLGGLVEPTLHSLLPVLVEVGIGENVVVFNHPVSGR